MRYIIRFWYNFLMSSSRYSFTTFPVFVSLALAGCSTAIIPAIQTPTAAALTPYFTPTASLTPMIALEPSQQIIFTPTPTPFLYTLQKDELVSTVALRYGVSLAQIQAANPNVNLNYPGKNQQLVIPPPEKTPAPDLSSPTPAVLTIQNVSCYPAADGAGLCLGLLQNNQPNAVMYITGKFILEGKGGTQQKPFTSLLDTLPSGSQIPVYALFDVPFPYPYRVNLVIHTGFSQSGNAPASKLEIVEQQVDITSDGLTAKVEGKIKLNGNLPDKLAIVAAGYSGYIPAGVRRMEISPQAAQDGLIPFKLWIYSAGPFMDRAEVFVEKY